MRKLLFFTFIFQLVFIFLLQAREQQMQFKHLDISHGLSSNQIKTIFEDSRGQIWIGTVHGLNRFDGYTNKIFLKNQNDTTSLPDNNIISISESHDEKLWINTLSQLTIFDPVEENFSRHDPLFHKNIPLPRNGYTKIFTDSHNNFWLFHRQNGIYKYDPKADSLSLFRSGELLMPYYIESVSEDADGNFWIMNQMPAIEVFNPYRGIVVKRYILPLSELPTSTNQYTIHADSDLNVWIYAANDDKGVFYLDTKTEEITHYHSRSDTHKISHDNISALISNNEGNILIGSDHGGLNVVNKETGSISFYENEFGDRNSLSQNSITSIILDSNNIIWIGTYKKGVNYYHPDLFKFSTYTLNPLRDDWLTTEDVNTFAEDQKGNLWVGTNGGGLLYFDRINNTFKTFRSSSDNINALSSDVIVDLCVDKRGGLWIGTFTGGLSYYNGGQFTRFMHESDNENSILSNNVWAVHEDSRGQIWIGTLGGGISVIDPETLNISHLADMVDEYLISNFIMAIAEDEDENLWFSTAYGVIKYNPVSKELKQLTQQHDSENSLSSNSTLDIYSDSRGWIWIATHEGLNLYCTEYETFRVFGIDDGLPDNMIVTILEADDGNMWLATARGLSNLIIEKDSTGQHSFVTRNYDERDGLHGKEFNEHAAFKTSKGELIFGGVDGFSIFNPAHLNAFIHEPRIFMSELKVQNKKVEPGQEVNQRVLLEKALSYTHEITLNHFEKTFSLTLSALNYFNPEKSLFHYKLEGFNDEWTTMQASSREITYTNLNPGNYILKVYVSDMEDSSRSDIETLLINVLPPFWQTKWAYSAYLVIVLLLIFYAMQLIIRRERNKFLIQQERTEALRTHEMDMMKLKFFTNISHEFRTPLTLIISPLERIIKKASDPGQREQLLLIKRNAQRLLKLVNQLLDFRRLEVQGLQLEISQGELISFCRETVESFSDMSETRNIQLTYKTNIEKLNARFDYDKIEKILFNLLSNAFKFTPENGSILVSVFIPENKQNVVDIVVEDSGIGVQKENQESIFERFVQNDTNGFASSKGSGIGLSLTREFVKMHQGQISLESEPDNGSRFIVTLPLKDEFEWNESQAKVITREIKSTHEAYKTDNAKAGNRSKLLLVEDNPDIRFYLKDNLSSDYKIYEAANGNKAWELIPELLPDLIVSDIMMPGMDGIELCKRIKTDKRTSHIPVILLTARSTDQHRFQGFETGADDYITKPFNFELLQLRIAKLIEQRVLARQQFQKNFDLTPSEINITSLDEKFLGKVKELTENNMQEPDFSVEKLSREIGISRAHLYNKLLALTGKTPIEYIRIMRIRRAAQLLEKSQLTIMEVAYKVGFNDPRYFTKHFKSEYKMTPTQYIKKHAK